jgi:hypothetical protein
MPTLPNVEVPVLELKMVNAENKMQQGIEKAAGVVRREIGGRLNGNDDQPQNGGDPGLEHMVTIGAQAGRQPIPPPFAENAKDGLPNVVLTPRLQAVSFPLAKPVLLDRIVRSLTGNHHIVHMALAESSAADAHEARLLQQLWNRGATAVAHARL